MKAHNFVRASLAIGLGISIGLTLSACWPYFSEEKPPDLSEEQPPGQEVSDGSVGSDSTDPTVLPSTFPAEIPLFNDNIAFANYVEVESSWTVLLMTQDLNADFNSACTQLADAGFTSSFYQQEGNDSLATFDGATYRIQLVGRDDADHGDVLDYFVMSLE